MKNKDFSGKYFLKSIISIEKLDFYLQKYYKLEDISNIVLIKSYINDLYEITHQNKKYVLKIFDSNKTLEEIYFEMDFIEFLNNEIKTYEIIRTANNIKVIKIDYQNCFRYAILMNYIKGIQPKYKDKKDAFKYGYNIKKFHLVSSKFTHEKPKQVNIFENLNTAIKLINKYLTSENLYVKDFEQIIFNLNEKIKLIDFSKLTMMYCHGDLHGGNIIYRKNESFFIDFDCCGYNYLTYELSIFLWSCLIGKRYKYWKDFLYGYSNIGNNIRYEDLEHVLLFVAIRDIIIMSKYLKNINTIGKEIINYKYIKKRLEFLNNILKEIII